MHLGNYQTQKCCGFDLGTAQKGTQSDIYTERNSSLDKTCVALFHTELVIAYNCRHKKKVIKRYLQGLFKELTCKVRSFW